MSVLSNEWRSAARKAPRVNSERLILALMVLLIGLLSVAPLMRLVWTAIAPNGVPDIARLTRLLASDRVLIASGNTLLIALSSTLISVVLGTAAAWLVALSDLRAKTAWVFAFILPLMIPPQVTALAWLQALAPSSPLALLFATLGLPWFAPGEQPLYSLTGIVLLLGTHNAPLVFLTVRAGLRRLPADLVEAAQASGASRARILFTIVLPLARPAIFAGAALTFVAAAGNFGIQAMLGIPARVPTLITLVYQQLNGIGPSALPNTAVYALLIAVITLAGMAASAWLGGRHDVRVNGAPRLWQQSLGRGRVAIEGVAWLWMALTLLLPLSALLITALTSGFGQVLSWQTLTLENFRAALWGYPAVRHAFLTSLGLTTLAALILTVCALFLAYFLSWRRTKLVRGLWLASELTYALPGIVTGVAAMLFFLRPLPIVNVSLYGTVWIILAAYLANFLALVLRPTLAGFAQLEPALDEAARLCGAGFLRRMRDILLPLAAPSALAGSVLVFLTALNEIQVSVLLVTSQTQTIGPTIVFLDEGGSASLAAAVGCLMIVVVCLLMALATRLTRRLPHGILPWQA
ncbi:iron(III) transport system permease protein [Candidatus Pantoea symbiotica]|jgi:iron(III) transport system permease protein|uniref:Iron(III) transport system permease protein n=1 Tax=Candidatus Pantoea symbiotica TaxID=1884370 RepID=A0A1I3V347_9GAMM|nr:MULTISPECIES: iron ABC transporter permease [Pantoea]KAJ9431788.1 iron ABC transporter permease [Pantoea sp. YR343]SFJ90064.1 iron(III) transport system permease protein [Pantoea symbiotica]SFU62984.1 iron(III) transport system permease protein [Pantoea sp. YR525]